MKRIPGTLYEIEITRNQKNTHNLKIWCRKRLVLETTQVSEEDVPLKVKNLLENNGLPDIMRVMILANSRLNTAKLHEIEDLYVEVSNQIRKVMV